MAVVEKMTLLRRIYGNKKIVVSVDPLDYTRGIPHKLLAMKDSRHLPSVGLWTPP